MLGAGSSPAGGDARGRAVAGPWRGSPCLCTNTTLLPEGSSPSFQLLSSSTCIFQHRPDPWCLQAVLGEAPGLLAQGLAGAAWLRACWGPQGGGVCGMQLRPTPAGCCGGGPRAGSLGGSSTVTALHGVTMLTGALAVIWTQLGPVGVLARAPCSVLLLAPRPGPRPQPGCVFGEEVSLLSVGVATSSCSSPWV